MINIFGLKIKSFQTALIFTEICTYMIDPVVNNLSGGPSSLRLPDIVQGCAAIIQRTHFVLVGFRISVFDKIRPKQDISLLFGSMIVILNLIENNKNNER